MENKTILIEIKGDSVKSIEQLCQITGKSEPLDVILAALRVYTWILAKQANGGVIVAEYPDESRKAFQGREEELKSYIKNDQKDRALGLFDGRDLF